MSELNPSQIRASERAYHLRDFGYHATVFVFINALLVIVDVRAGSGSQAILGLDWAYWVILFWGLGLVSHAVYAFSSASDHNESLGP